MSAAVEVSTRVRVSDPAPAHCSMCFQGAREGLRFFDCGAAFDAGSVIDLEHQAYISGADDLHICESCVQELTEAAAYKPELHSRQLREIKRLELQRDHWRDTAARKDREIAKLNEYVATLEHHRGGKR